MHITKGDVASSTSKPQDGVSVTVIQEFSDECTWWGAARWGNRSQVVGHSTTNVEEKASLPKVLVSMFSKKVEGSEPSARSDSPPKRKLQHRSLFSMSSCLWRMEFN